MSCTYRIMRDRELSFEKLLGKHVRVEASGCVVEGRLLQVETSEHNGFGNIVLQTKEGPILVRGSTVQAIGEVKKHG